jgi:6-phosphogluconolactonase
MKRRSDSVFTDPKSQQHIDSELTTIMTRFQSFLKLLLVPYLFSLFQFPNMALAEELTVWIGIGTPQQGEAEGIYRATLDVDSGALSTPDVAAEIAQPGFLAMNESRTRLYSICRLADGEGGVAVFEISDDGKSLRLLNSQPIGDGEACHLALDATERYLFTAQYGSGSVAVFRITEGGRLGPRSALARHHGSGPNRLRQEGPHPHWVGTDPGNRFLFVPDLGNDQVVIYRMDLERGLLNRHGIGRCPAGAGPRHMKFHPNGRFAYVINELDLSVTAFQYDQNAGSLTPIQTITTLPNELRGDADSGSEIRIHPSGRFVYAANRGHDSITVFAVDSDSGRLRFVEREPVRGKHPRNFNLDPSGKWLLAAGRDSNTISVLRIDNSSGALQYTGTSVRAPAPICIAF